MSQGNSKQYVIYEIETSKVYEIKSLAGFCASKGLSESCMRDVAKGRQKQHRGFICTEKQGVPIEVRYQQYAEMVSKSKPDPLPRKTKAERYNRSEKYQHFLENVSWYYHEMHVGKSMSCRAIAQELGVDAESVRKAFESRGLDRQRFFSSKLGDLHPTRARYTNQQRYARDNFVSVFQELHVEANLPLSSVAERMGLCKTTVINYCREFGLEYNRKSISSQHAKISKLLMDLGVEHTNNVRSIITPHELDIAIPGHNLSIEINGLFWHRASRLGSVYHVNKLQAANKAGFALMQFWDVEVDQKFPIVESIIKTRLGLTDTKHFARDLVVQEIDYTTAGQFCAQNHIQGARTSKYNYALYNDNQIVMVMTFNSHPTYEFEIVRSCTALNTNVAGGASKLLSYFEKKHNPKTMMSFADRRLFSGGVYSKMGFTLEKVTQPNYWYFHTSEYQIKSRQMFQKHKLADKLANYDPMLSEQQNMLNHNYERVYDCGSLLFVKRY